MAWKRGGDPRSTKPTPWGASVSGVIAPHVEAAANPNAKGVKEVDDLKVHLGSLVGFG
jgi:hypothetical protein